MPRYMRQFRRWLAIKALPTLAFEVFPAFAAAILLGLAVASSNAEKLGGAL